MLSHRAFQYVPCIYKRLSSLGDKTNVGVKGRKFVCHCMKITKGIPFKTVCHKKIHPLMSYVTRGFNKKETYYIPMSTSSRVGCV